jgi:AcrR family transcriptional regulator
VPTDATQSTRPQQERAARTRLRILDTAAVAFAEHGYDGVSLNEVIRRSGLTKGAFYHHFASRDELALATFRHKQQQLVSQMQHEVDPNAPPLVRLATLLRDRARLLARDPSLFVVVRLGVELSVRHGSGSEYATFTDLPLQLFRDIVQEGQKRGEIRVDLKPGPTAETIFAGVLGIDQAALITSDQTDLSERTEWLLDVLVNGIAVPATEQPQPKETS